MLTAELLRQIRTIELRARKLVYGAFVGAYHSIYKGKGMTFSSVRPYVFGDDIRAIDWKVTARSNTPHIKEFVEERELTLTLLIDGSASVLFGTIGQNKSEFAATLGAILAYCATFNNDRVGLMLFTDKIEHRVPAHKGRKHVTRLIRDLLLFQPIGKTTDLGNALNTLNRVSPLGSIVVIISDFLVDTETYIKQLMFTAKRHQVITIIINDMLEEQFPQVGLIGLQDAETQAITWADTHSTQWQGEFANKRAELTQQRYNALKKLGIPQLELNTSEDPVPALRLFFEDQLRQKRT